VQVADIDGEEFEEARARFVTSRSYLRGKL
jgi:hypothetical protein